MFFVLFKNRIIDFKVNIVIVIDIRIFVFT